jgi:ketosteroid isomerase-like protein
LIGGIVNAKQALAEVCESWNQLDPDRLAALFTDDGRYEDPLKASALVGKAEVRDGNAPAMEALGRCKVTLGLVAESGDAGFAEGFFSSELREGGRLDFPFMLLVEMEGGKIRRVAEYFDTRPLVP